MKYTPGPWKIGYNDKSGMDTIRTDKDGQIAVIRWGCGCCKTTIEEKPLSPEEQGNARLLANSPEMYELLKNIDECLGPDSTWEVPYSEEIFVLLRKIEGRPE